ncbi:MAG: pyruvate formate lyase family protein [Halanaerobiaceae bacterium]
MVIKAEDYVRKLMSQNSNNLQVTKRVKQLQKKVKNNMQKSWAGWSDYGSVLNEETKDWPLVVRKAMAIKSKLENVPVGLWEGQLIAGSFKLVEKGLMLDGDLPDYATSSEHKKAAEYGFSEWSTIGHIVPDYSKLLTKGIRGILKKIEEKKESTSDPEKVNFLEAAKISLKGLKIFSERYARLCHKLAPKETDDKRKRELKQMAKDLEYAPFEPAENLSQALNSIWLTHLAFQLTRNHLAVGRLDQLIAPYLIKDLKTGRLDLNSAQELIDCFFLKFNERAQDNDITEENIDLEKAQKNKDESWKNRTPFDHNTQKENIRDNIDATNHWLQNVIVGGVKPEDGSDATNLATIMALESFHRNQMTNPCTTVRFHSGSPDYLYDMVGEVLITGGGLPAIFNDEAIIPSLVKNNFPLKAARDYTNDGCWEVLVPGKTDFYFDRFNMLKCLEWTLNHGCSRIDGKKEAPDQGDPKEFSSFAEVMAKFQDSLEYVLQGIMDKISNRFGKRALITPTPLLSTLLEGPIENGQDMMAGGTRFKTYGLIGEGLSHLIDSLAAMKKVIFEEQQAGMEDLITALDNNFAGYTDLHEKLKQAPKYGNNDPYADQIGQRVLSYFTEKVDELNQQYEKINFLPGVGTFSWYIAIGEGLGPSPDGRLKAEPVSSNFSPSVGAATKGVTGAINSFSKMNLDELPVGSPVDLRISSKLVTGSGGQKRLTGLLKTFIEKGGNMLTLSVADVETLKEAQKEPDDYENLRVRMGGWSAYFTMLSEEQQEHHIRKQESL